ncbi:MAG: hypothetical protein K2K69_02525 [Muribaculaceae bacterium]|nr:hypothetical protein [Muribaculaceae bacterium]
MEILQQLLGLGAGEIIGITGLAVPNLTRYTSDFSLHDTEACGVCRKARAQQCNHETMMVHPLNPIAVFALHEWISSFPKNKRINFPNCDYIFADAENMYASRKIAFCDITCSESRYVNPGTGKYPQGKRAYVLSQMESLAGWLMKNSLLRHYISTATNRRMIFGVRYSDRNPANKATAAMQSFSRTPSSTASTITSQQYIDNIPFEYVEVSYPATLTW